MYLWLPLILDVLIMIVLSRMNVEAVNEKLKAEKGIKSDEERTIIINTSRINGNHKYINCIISSADCGCVAFVPT